MLVLLKLLPNSEVSENPLETMIQWIFLPHIHLDPKSQLQNNAKKCRKS